MSVSSLREFLENCVYRHGGLNCSIKYLHRKLLTTNFSLMILKVLKNVHLLRDRYINEASDLTQKVRACSYISKIVV
jgi:hypothetical protein